MAAFTCTKPTCTVGRLQATKSVDLARAVLEVCVTCGEELMSSPGLIWML